MHAFVRDGSVFLFWWTACFLISLVMLKILSCGLCNNGDGFWLNNFCLRLLPNFGLPLIWYSSILLLSLFSTLSRSSRILTNFNLFLPLLNFLIFQPSQVLVVAWIASLVILISLTFFQLWVFLDLLITQLWLILFY